MTSVLTGEQLVSCRARLDRELPTLGFKEFQPANTDFEQRQIQHALEERKVLLSEERIEKCGNISAAEWKPELMRAQVTKKVGKHWEVFGHHKDNSEWLFPEEALFMLETNSLELSYSGVPMSVQKGYTILINNSKTDCTLSEYRVYLHLSRQGYRVLRHLPDLTVTSYEKQINLDQYILDQKRSYDVERSQQSYASVSERTVSFSELESKEDVSNVTENIMTGISRIVESTLGILTQENSKPMTDSVPSTSGTVSHEVVILDESTVESDIIEEPVSRRMNLEDGDDLDVIEVPQEPKEVIIETIDSDTSSEDTSDNANEDSSSDSESDSDVHWKRRSLQRSSPPVEDKFNVRVNYLTEREFLFDCETLSKKSKPVLIDLEDDGKETVTNNIEVIDLSSDSENETSCVAEYVNKSRREILDGMPVMNNINGYVSITCPDLRLIPDNIRPHKHEYSLLISRVRGGGKPRQATNYRNYRNYNQQRNYPRWYQNANSLFNRMRPNPWSRHGMRQANANPMVLQQATQIQSVAQGMLQFVSSLVNQICHPQVNHNSNWNMSMPRFSSPAWQGTDVYNTNALEQRNFYNEQRGNDSANFSVLPVSQNTNHYQRHQMPAQSNNSFRSQYNLTTVNSYANSVSNENSPVYHTNANNFSPTVNSYSQNSSSSVENVFDVNNGEYTPKSTKRYNSPNKRYQRRGGGGFHRGLARARQSLQPRHGVYQVNNMKVEQNRYGSEDPVNSHERPYSHEDPAYSREDPAYCRADVPLHSDGFIPLSSGSNNNNSNSHQGPRSNFRNNRRRKRQNFDVVNVEDVDDDIVVMHSSRKRLKQENGQKKKKLQGRKRYFSVSPEQSLTKQQKQNEDEAEIIVIDVTSEELDVKREKGNHSLSTTDVLSTTNDMTDVKPNVSENISQASHCASNIKFENTDIKTDILSVPVKRESFREQEDQQQHHTSEASRELVRDVKPASRELVRDIKPDVSHQLDVKNLSLTQNEVAAQTSESLEVKAESDLEHQISTVKTEKDVSHNKENTQEDRSISSNIIKQEPESGETTVEIVNHIENVHEYVTIEHTAVIDAGTEENINITDNCQTDDERVASSWAEFKNRPIPIGIGTSANAEESEGVEGEEEEEDIEDDTVQPILKPQDCKDIGSILSVLQIFNRGEPPQHEVCRLKISFDMYLPSTSFKKVQRSLPNYRIVVVESLDPLPGPGEMAELRLRFQDGVQILLAVVMPDSVAFYTFGSVSLPVDDTSYKI